MDFDINEFGNIQIRICGQRVFPNVTVSVMLPTLFRIVATYVNLHLFYLPNTIVLHMSCHKKCFFFATRLREQNSSSTIQLCSKFPFPLFFLTSLFIHSFGIMVWSTCPRKLFYFVLFVKVGHKIIDDDTHANRKVIQMVYPIEFPIKWQINRSSYCLPSFSISWILILIFFLVLLSIVLKKIHYTNLF